MVGFRFVALGYALLVFLIAPSWLAADDQPPPAVPVPPAVEESAEAVPEVPLATPAPASGEAAAPAVEPAPEPGAEPKPKPKAEPAKVAKRDQPESEPVAKTAASASVTIRDFEFDPATVTVNEGDTITWTNEGPTVHTATAEDGSFDTGSLRKGESGSATFTQAGTINYICQPHPNMTGTVVVQAASSGTGGGGSGSDGDSSAGSSSDDPSGVASQDSSSDTTGGLPDTGGEALSIALLGLATLGYGLLLRRHRSEM